MATSKIVIDEGTGTNVATTTFSEDGVTKHLQRFIPTTSAGAEITTQPVSLATAPTTPVTGTFWQTTQPVSLATAPTTPVTGTFFQATQPVSFTGSTDVATQTTLATLNTKVTAVNTGAVVLSSGTVTTVSTVTNVSQNGGVAISLNAGAVDTGTRRVVQANGAGKTILSTGGSASTSGSNTLVAAGTNKLKVFAFSLSTTSTTAMTCIFQSGTGGTELWRVVLQAGTSVSTGANLAVSPPAWLFATGSATLLNLNLSSGNAVHWSVSYFDEA